MKRVFICSPWSGGGRKNTEIARLLMADAIAEGHAPFVPHLLYPQVLTEVPRDRATGLKMGLHWLRACDELWYVGQPTDGMASEITMARQWGIKIVEREVVS